MRSPAPAATASALRRAFSTATCARVAARAPPDAGPDLERDPGLLEDRPPLRRGRREDQSSGKNSAASRSADSGESDPWTMFLPTSIAKSPRIEPGVGLERVRRADHLAGGRDGLLALEHHRDQRAGGDEVDQLAEERLALVLGVVLLGELRVSIVMCLSATMRRPLRSKRAMISPVRPRANASGLTRIRVLSTGPGS